MGSAATLARFRKRMVACCTMLISVLKSCETPAVRRPSASSRRLWSSSRSSAACLVVCTCSACCWLASSTASLARCRSKRRERHQPNPANSASKATKMAALRCVVICRLLASTAASRSRRLAISRSRRSASSCVLKKASCSRAWSTCSRVCASKANCRKRAPSFTSPRFSSKSPVRAKASARAPAKVLLLASMFFSTASASLVLPLATKASASVSSANARRTAELCTSSTPCRADTKAAALSCKASCVSASATYKWPSTRASAVAAPGIIRSSKACASLARPSCTKLCASMACNTNAICVFFAAFASGSPESARSKAAPGCRFAMCNMPRFVAARAATPGSRAFVASLKASA